MGLRSPSGLGGGGGCKVPLLSEISVDPPVCDGEYWQRGGRSPGSKSSLVGKGWSLGVEKAWLLAARVGGKHALEPLRPSNAPCTRTSFATLAG